MAKHIKRNFRPRTKAVGAVTGLALLLGGGFATQAFADSEVKPGADRPKVSVPDGSAPGVEQPGSTKPKGDAPRVTDPGSGAKSNSKGKTGAATPSVSDKGSDAAPRVIQPGSGAQK